MFVARSIKKVNYTICVRRLKILSASRIPSTSFSSTAVKTKAIKVELDEDLEHKLESNELAPRKHFGRNKLVPYTVPQRIQRAMVKVVGDYPIKALVEAGEAMNRYIRCRKTAMEEANRKLKMQELESLVLSDTKKYKLPKMPTDESDVAAVKLFQSRKKQQVEMLFNQRVYTWRPIVYDAYRALTYLIGRSAREYGSIMRIFKEIQRRDPDFIPRSYFDFGAGVGTGVWAVSELWNSSVYEYFLVDSSKYMNDLAELLLRDGDVNKAMSLRNVYYRQFLPASNDKYDIVMSAYSLFEMPTLKNRLEVANSLWKKTAQYLVFVEVGTNQGFQALNEIRDYLLKVNEVEGTEAFIFSPCPHENTCPRKEANDGTPCNFPFSYFPLSFSDSGTHRNDNFCYLVIKRGQPKASDRWPRVVRPTMLRHKHVICRLCTSEGKLGEGIFTKSKQGKTTYKCVKHSEWGDQLPLTILDGDGDAEELEKYLDSVENEKNISLQADKVKQPERSFEEEIASSTSQTSISQESKSESLNQQPSDEDNSSDDDTKGSPQLRGRRSRGFRDNEKRRRH